jgi:HAD superfamily hydrolase (TIGR01509 family)
MDFRAAIFDMDGTLIDSQNAWKSSYAKTLASIGFTMTDKEFELIYRMTSDETREYFREIYDLRNHDGKISFETLMHEYNAEIENKYAFEIKEKPNALKYLKTLHENGIPMCVATLSSIDLAKKVLTRLGFAPFLKFIITGDDVGLSKKFPDIYLAAAKKLSSTPLETAVFEDCPTAIETAHKAGFIVCAVAEPHQNHSNVHSHCHLCINNFSEII